MRAPVRNGLALPVFVQVGDEFSITVTLYTTDTNHLRKRRNSMNRYLVLAEADEEMWKLNWVDYMALRQKYARHTSQSFEKRGKVTNPA